MKKAGSILSDVIREHPLAKLKALARLRAAWTETVGEAVAAHALPVDLREGTLIVEVDGSVWMQQLSFLKPQMVARLKGQDVTDIRFVLRRTPGAGAKRPATRTSSKWVTLKPQDEAFIETCGATVDDPELKEHILRLLQTALSRRKSG